MIANCLIFLIIIIIININGINFWINTHKRVIQIVIIYLVIIC